MTPVLQSLKKNQGVYTIVYNYSFIWETECIWSFLKNSRKYTGYTTVYPPLQHWMIQYNIQDLTIPYDNKKLKAATIFRKMWALSL